MKSLDASGSLTLKIACGDTAAKSFQFLGIEAAIDGPSWPGPEKWIVYDSLDLDMIWWR